MMTRLAALFAALVAIAVLLLLDALDFGKLPYFPDRPGTDAPTEEVANG